MRKGEKYSKAGRMCVMSDKNILLQSYEGGTNKHQLYCTEIPESCIHQNIMPKEQKTNAGPWEGTQISCNRVLLTISLPTNQTA